MSTRDPADAVEVLDLLLKFFGDGERWGRGRLSDRPNHVGIAVQRHLRAGRIQERDGKLYAISPAT